MPVGVRHLDRTRGLLRLAVDDGVVVGEGVLEVPYRCGDRFEVCASVLVHAAEAIVSRMVRMYWREVENSGKSFSTRTVKGRSLRIVNRLSPSSTTPYISFRMRSSPLQTALSR